jgi:hypothetical protein
MAMIQKKVPATRIKTTSEVVNRDPMPKTYSQSDISGGVFQPNTTGRLSYQNKTNESSEVHRIAILTPPLVQVSIKKTINNQEIEIVPMTYIADLPTEDGRKVIDFRRVANKPLTVGRSEYIYIDLVHAYNSNQLVTVIVEKDQLLWVDSNVVLTG